MSHESDLEIFTDFNCVWCYFSHGHVKQIKNTYDVNVVWRAFPLHPDAPPEGMPIRLLFGNQMDLMIEKMTLLETKADQLGLPLKARTMISNTRWAQELGKWADSLGRIDVYHRAMHQAYFADGLDIGDRQVLMDVVAACGLSREAAEKVLVTGAFSTAVDEDWERSEVLEIMAAPSYVLNGDVRMGPQSFDELEDLFQRHQVPKKQPA